MAAVMSVRCNSAVKPFYKRLVEKGKAKKLALTAVMRKIIIIINNIVKNKRPWQEQYKQIILTSLNTNHQGIVVWIINRHCEQS
ncbi:hypothetical protein RAS_01520 [Rickettsia asiatica]|uniref:Transposase n=2 Tax=Rickettsia asiatica TaxID=238800 RepID=A0A510G697_9RICK|nr:hypothetical protein RAS_01520 [Rickettsia asiatica]